MGKHIVEATLPISAEDYWAEKDSEEFIALQCKVMDFESITKLDEYTLENGGTFNFIRTKPNIELPATLQKLMGGKDFLFDDEVYLPKSAPPYVIESISISPIMPSKADIKNVMTITPIDENTCIQRIELDVSIRLFGFASLIEGIIVDSVKKTYTQLPALIEKWNEHKNKTSLRKMETEDVFYDADEIRPAEISWDDSIEESKMERGWANEFARKFSKRLDLLPKEELDTIFAENSGDRYKSTDLEGYFLKIGNSVKTWNKRWFKFDSNTRILTYYLEQFGTVKGKISVEDIYCVEFTRDHNCTIELVMKNRLFVMRSTNEQLSKDFANILSKYVIEENSKRMPGW